MSINQGSLITATDVNNHINNTSNPHAVTASQIGAISGNNNLAAGIDFNTITTSGFYRFNNNNTNGPGVDWGQLLVMHGGGDTITQLVGDFSSGALYTRSGNPSDVGGSGSWTSWRKLAFNDEMPKKMKKVVSGSISMNALGGGSNNQDFAESNNYFKTITTLDFVPDFIHVSNLSGSVTNNGSLSQSIQFTELDLSHNTVHPYIIGTGSQGSRDRDANICICWRNSTLYLVWQYVGDWGINGSGNITFTFEAEKY